MARSHLGSRNHSGLGIPPTHLCRSRRGSVGLAYLGVMSGHPTTQQAHENGDDVHDAVETALSLKELAAQLQVSTQTLYDLRSQGRGPTGYRVGRHLRFRQSEIDAWLTRLEEEDAERHGAMRR